MSARLDPGAWLSWLRSPSERRVKATALLLAIVSAAAGASLAALAGAPAAIVVATALIAGAAAGALGLWLLLGDRGSAFEEIDWLRERLEPLRLQVSEAAPRRVNVIMGKLDPRHAFAGFVGSLNLARRLAERGHRVRIVTVEPSPRFLPSVREGVEAFAGLRGIFESVEVASAFDRGRALEASPDDAWLATSWWGAHLAHHAARETSGPFLFLIQEYEPSFFPAGSRSALAEEAYRLPHAAIFSTEILRSHFRDERLGVFAGSQREGERRSVAFEHAMTPTGGPGSREPSDARRLLFYARPEMHAARNMFELGILALERALATGALPADWELDGIGSVSHGRRIDLVGGRSMALMARVGEAAYAELLARYSVGVSLMHAPHPSLVPLEMAGAGLLTVTTVFRGKDAETLRAISPNLIPVEPTVAGVAAGIGDAVAAAGDRERRASGARFEWSRNWDGALGDDVMGRIDDLIRDGASDAG